MSLNTVDKAKAWDALSESYDKGFIRGMEFAAKVVEMFLLDGEGRSEEELDGATYGRKESAKAIRSAIAAKSNTTQARRD